jgi:PAS domain S-box-containing protein
MAAALREKTVSKEYMDNLIESMQDCVIVASSDGVIKNVNGVTSNLLGFSESELQGSNMTALFAESGIAEMEPRDQSLEITLKTRSGKSVPALVSVSAVREPNGKASGVVCVAKDITELKRAESELKRKSAELEALYTQVKDANDGLRVTNLELEAFSYSVSHDLRAPLRGIDGFSKILIDDHYEKLDDEGKGYLKRVRAATQRMGALIDDMLGLAKVTRKEIRKENVNLSEMARKISDQLKMTSPERDVEFSIAATPLVSADAGLMLIVLENLLGNAFKFSSKKTKAKIEFGYREENGKQIFFVKDDGAGFDMKYADKLFGSFQRMHSFEDFAGTGIGLATVKRIILRHGGDITADSQVGQGATFSFYV